MVVDHVVTTAHFLLFLQGKGRCCRVKKENKKMEKQKEGPFYEVGGCFRECFRGFQGLSGAFKGGDCYSAEHRLTV